MDNISNILQHKQNPIELFNSLNDIRISDRTQEGKTSSSIIIELHNNQGIDICEYAIQAINNNFNCFTINHTLSNSIPRLNLNLSTYCDYLEILFEKFSNNLSQYQQYENTRKLLEEQPLIAKDLLNKLIEKNSEFSVEHISICLSHLFKKSFKNIINYTNTDNKYTIQGAIIALGNYEYKDSMSANDTLDILKKIALDDFDNMGHIVVLSLLKMQHHGDNFKSVILDFLKTNNVNIFFQVAVHLWRNCESKSHEEWFKDYLMTLDAISCEYKGIINNLDNLLSTLVKTNKVLFEEFFTSWIINSDYSQSQDEINNLFNSTFYALNGNKEIFQKLITNYLNNDNQVVVKAGVNLISSININQKSTIEFDKEILKKLDIQDIVYICRKMLGHLIDVNTLCTLSYSILRTRIRNKQISGVVINVFTDYIGYNYPHKTLEFLNEKISKNTISKSLLDAINNIISKINEQCEVRNSLPELKELRCSDMLIHDEYIAQTTIMNKAMEVAQQGSLMSTINTIHLKYGNSSRSYINNEYSEPLKMHHFSHSIDIPSTSIFHEVSFELERFHFRIANRNEQ